MNKFSILLVALPFFLSCKKESTPPLLRIQVKNLQFTVDAANVQPPFTPYIPIPDVRTNALSLLAANGIDTANIQSIRPGRATLSVFFNEDQLNFIDALSIRLCPLNENEINCGREAFYRDPVPIDAGFDLDLVPSNVNDLRELVLQDRINVQVKFERLRDSPNGTFDINLDMEFEVR
ncbi:MAG: hypothetical protein H6577_11545 [Lewinellaceae bacterium]|nr:hypothetical protein [Saprospiraceae bacterium]MCB9338750.1 hypothetical protein [Lewinellaceae bacterium]